MTNRFMIFLVVKHLEQRPRIYMKLVKRKTTWRLQDRFKRDGLNIKARDAMLQNSWSPSQKTFHYRRFLRNPVIANPYPIRISTCVYPKIVSTNNSKQISLWSSIFLIYFIFYFTFTPIKIAVFTIAPYFKVVRQIVKRRACLTAQYIVF